LVIGGGSTDWAVFAAAADVPSGFAFSCHRVSPRDRSLVRDNGIGAGGHGGTRRYLDRTTGREQLERCLLAREQPPDDPPRPAPRDCVPVHRCCVV
jgi:hypothetical protein